MRIILKGADFSGISIGQASNYTVNYDLEKEGLADCYYGNGGEVGSTISSKVVDFSPTATTALNAMKIKAPSGSKVYLEIYGGRNGRAYAFANSSNQILEKSDALLDATNGITLTAPEGSEWIYVNNNRAIFPLSKVVISITYP